MIFTEEEQREIIEETRTSFSLFFPELVERPCCLYWAWLLAKQIDEYLSKKNHPGTSLIQAGTALWPIVRPDQDNGVSETHWGYQWDGPGADQLNLIAEQEGHLKEVHVWVAIVPRRDGVFTPELIDITTGLWPKLKVMLTKEEHWPGDDPPDYLWVSEYDLPEGVVYDPSERAIEYALSNLIKLRQEGDLP